MFEKPDISDKCKISKASKKRIDFLSRLGFQLMVVPIKEYEGWKNSEDSLNYVSEGLYTYDLDLPYIHVIHDKISQVELETMIYNEIFHNRALIEELLEKRDEDC